MDPVDYIARRKLLHRYVTSDYMQGTLADVGEQAQKDEAFLGHPTAHKAEYTKIHKVLVDLTWEKIKDFFDTCSAADKASGKYEELATLHKQSITVMERKVHAATPYKGCGKPLENRYSRSTDQRNNHKTPLRGNSYYKGPVDRHSSNVGRGGGHDSRRDYRSNTANGNTNGNYNSCCGTRDVSGNGRGVVKMIAITLTTSNVIVPKVVLACHLTA